MVLETAVSPGEATKHPLFLVFFAIVANSVAIWTALFVFPGSSSVISIAFLTISVAPLIHSILVLEETREARHEHRGLSSIFFIRHLSVLRVYAWLFVGLIFSYSLWYAVMPEQQREQAFLEQKKILSEISQLKASLTGLIAAKAGSCGQDALCWGGTIFSNNAKVLLLSILFSLIYGAGAVFLIAWQASVIGTLIGIETLKLASMQTQTTWIGVLPLYVIGFLTGFLGLAPHGIPEATGYFIGAIAGGIISAAISKKRFSMHEVTVITKDAIILIAIALALLLVGAWIEATAIVQSLS